MIAFLALLACVTAALTYSLAFLIEQVRDIRQHGWFPQDEGGRW